MRNLISIIAVFGIVALSAPTRSFAEGNIELTTTAEQVVTTTDDRGKEVTTIVPAGKVVPGNVILYTITAKNISDQSVNGVVINDPIPEHMVYLIGSVAGSGTDITFSIDGGTNFDKQDELEVSDGKGGTRVPEASDYTHIRWTLTENFEPQATKKVSFQARLE